MGLGLDTVQGRAVAGRQRTGPPAWAVAAPSPRVCTLGPVSQPAFGGGREDEAAVQAEPDT